MLRRHIGDQATATVNRLATKPHLGAHHQVPVQQATHTNQHDGRVRCDVADFVGRACLGCQHPAGALRRFARLQLHLPAPGCQQLPQTVGGSLRAFAQVTLGFVVKRFQALFADVFFVGLEVCQDLWRVAGNAQAGAQDQKGQDQQKPPRAVHRVQFQSRKQLGPKRTELVDVIGGRFVLLQHGANDRGNANDGQKRNGKPHGRQQLQHGLASWRSALGWGAGSDRRHGGKEFTVKQQRGCPAANKKGRESGLDCHAIAGIPDCGSAS